MRVIGFWLLRFISSSQLENVENDLEEVQTYAEYVKWSDRYPIAAARSLQS